MVVCPNCGKELPEGATFCSQCGQRLLTTPPPPPQPYYIRQKSRSHLGTFMAVSIVIVIALIVVVMFGLGGVKNVFQGALPPNIEITSKNAREGLSGLDWVGWVDVSVYNSGGKGTITVWVEVMQGSGQWKKSQSVYLEAQQSQNLTFEFKEISFGAGWIYSVWVTS